MPITFPHVPDVKVTGEACLALASPATTPPSGGAGEAAVGLLGASAQSPCRTGHTLSLQPQGKAANRNGGTCGRRSVLCARCCARLGHVLSPRPSFPVMTTRFRGGKNHGSRRQRRTLELWWSGREEADGSLGQRELQQDPLAVGAGGSTSLPDAVTLMLGLTEATLSLLQATVPSGLYLGSAVQPWHCSVCGGGVGAA